MRMPICEECLKNTELCEECNKKLENKEITDLDLKVCNMLFELYENNIIGDSSFEKTIETKDFIIIVTKSNVSTLIGKSGRIVRLLSEKMGKKVRTVKQGNIREIVNDLITPARMMGLTRLYTPTEEKQRILVPYMDRKRILLSEESIKKVVKELCDVNVEIKYTQ